MAAYEDVNVGIDPSVRVIIDANVNTIISVLNTGNKALFPLHILILMTDKNVLNYIDMYLPHAENI